MNTKICKYCKESILEDATKCPKCQSFQSIFRSPTFISLLSILFIPFAFFPLYLTYKWDNIKFIDYESKITLDVLSKDTLKREECKDCDLLNILVELKNDTELEWQHGEFEVQFKASGGKILNIEKIGDYQLILNPKSKAKSSLKVPMYQKYTNSEIEIRLIDLKYWH